MSDVETCSRFNIRFTSATNPENKLEKLKFRSGRRLLLLEAATIRRFSQPEDLPCTVSELNDGL